MFCRKYHILILDIPVCFFLYGGKGYVYTNYRLPSTRAVVPDGFEWYLTGFYVSLKKLLRRVGSSILRFTGLTTNAVGLFLLLMLSCMY